MNFLHAALLILTAPYIRADVPTLIPFQSFCAEQDAKDIHDAVDGLKTDEGKLINILCHRTYHQRMEINDQYSRIYKQYMIEKIEWDVYTDGEFGKVINGLLKSFEEYLASKLYDACDGDGTDEEVLIDVICPLNNTEKIKLVDKYEKIFNRKLYDVVNEETSGKFQNVIRHVCLATRNETPTLDPNIVEVATKELAQLGGDDFQNTLRKYILECTVMELQAIFDKYEQIEKHNIVKKIEKEYERDTKRAYKTLVRAIRNRTKYFAERMHECVDGTGTRDNCVQIIVISRCELDLQDIKNEYQAIFHESMRKRVGDDVSGDYKRAILQLIGTE